MQEYSNVKAAHWIMGVDQGYSKERIERNWDFVTLPTLLSQFGYEEMDTAESALCRIRQGGDTANIDSPLWEICAGDRADWPNAVREAAETGVTDAILEETFNLLGL